MSNGAETLKFKVDVIVEPDEDPFHAYCPALKGLHVDGATQQEALENARDAVRAYLDSIARHGDPVPVGPDLTAGHVEIPKKAIVWTMTIECPSPQMSGAR